MGNAIAKIIDSFDLRIDNTAVGPVGEGFMEVGDPHAFFHGFGGQLSPEAEGEFCYDLAGGGVSIAAALDRVIDVFSGDEIDVCAAFDAIDGFCPPDRHDSGDRKSVV